MRWCEGDEEGEVVVGGNGQGNQSNQLNLPSEPQSISPRKKATTTVLSQPTLGKLPEPNYQNMEYKKLLIGKNEEDVEMAAERVTAHNASSEYKVSSAVFKGANIRVIPHTIVLFQ
ncbi:unnamed protein product [Adineta steineri]|uniref:Uncharacterized protein n=1 Tax=Adineta steineri TaxID=433720 RepID=A0A813V6I1_9BILA|nr:unnamed protein product [Adineta steineri]